MAVGAQVERYGVPRDARGRFIPAVVVGLGKLGGRELTTGSDLDIFVTFGRADADTTDGETDGGERVDAHTFYSGAVERLASALGDITPAGIAFAVDLRLRPGREGRGLDRCGAGGASPARAASRRDAGSALSLPAPRLDGAAAARRAPHRHPRAGGADARAGGRRPRLFVARGLPRRLPRAHRGGAGGVHRGLRVSRRPALYVVDGHSNIFRAYHAMEYLSTSRGQPTHAILILSTMLWKLIREEQPEYLAIALDPPGPTFRDKLFAEYKATRTSMPSDLARQLPYIRRLFDALRTPVPEA